MHMSNVTTTKPCGCKPSCPTCDGLECLERPRFFCGQLLTDEDLDAAQRYVIEKNRLHNRYLVGSGVACGLMVECGTCCDCCLVINPGYAIDCCGNDIVVCRPEPFDVCAYIDRCFCRPDPCDDKPVDPCTKDPREYCLVLSYAEKPAHPVAALTEGCGCGGHGGSECSCGCGSGRPSKRQNGNCQYSRVQETFRLDLIPHDPKSDKPGLSNFLNDRFKSLIEFESKWAAIATAAEADLNLPAPTADPQTRHNLLNKHFTRMKDVLIDAIERYGAIACGYRKQLAGQLFPPLAPHALPPNYNAVFATLADTARRLTRELLCRAFLAPCPPCTEEGVVLACLTVADGKITELCNFPRRQLVTGPMLQGLFGLLMAQSRQSLEQICCERRMPSMGHTTAPAGSMSARLFGGANTAGDFLGGFAELIDLIAAPLSEGRLDLSSSRLHSVDLRGRLMDDAVRMLTQHNIKSTSTTLAPGARVPEDMRRSFELPIQGSVELLISDGAVVGARLATAVTFSGVVSGGASPGPTAHPAAPATPPENAPTRRRRRRNQ